MVFAQRITALQQQVMAGHQVSITYSYSVVSRKLKTKVNVSAQPGIVPMPCRHLLLAALQPILDSMWNAVIVDRGHTFSDGHACACFWIEPRSFDDTGANVEDVLDYLQPPAAALNPEAKEFFPPV